MGNGPSRITDPAVLNELIHLLGNAEPHPDHPESVTVADVAEALGHPEPLVQATLDRIHERRRREKLREVEEPLYRVERPGHGPTVGHGDPLFRIRTVEELTERATPKSLPGIRPKVGEPEPLVSRLVAQLILVCLGAGIVVLLVTSILKVTPLAGR